MKRESVEILLTGALLALLSQVATLGGAVLWSGIFAGAPVSGLSAILYAPFGLIALLSPALAAPVVKRAARPWGFDDGAGRGRLWPGPWRFAALLGIAETLTVAARMASGASALPPLALHCLLAAHTALATSLLGRSQHHASDSSHNHKL